MIEFLLKIILEVVFTLWIDFATFLVLTVTLIVVIVYTVFTKQQTDELITQRKLSIMPSLMHSLESGVTGRINITNLGSGTAINISIDPIKFPLNKNALFEFHPIGMIPPGKTLSVVYEFDSDSETTLTNHLNLLDMENLFFEKEIKFIFYDIEGTKYSQINTFGKNKYLHGPAVRL